MNSQILTKKPGEQAEIIDFPIDVNEHLRFLQKIVGGLIEAVPLFGANGTLSNLRIIANEEGLLQNPPMEPNIAFGRNINSIIVGPIAVVGVLRNGDFRRLRKAELASAKHFLDARSLIKAY